MQINDLYFAYDDNVIIDKLSFEIPRGKLLCLWGHSGIGKTTLFQSLAGLSGVQPDILRDKRIAYLFQDNRLLPHATALQNVASVTDEAGAEHWLNVVGLAECANLYPDEMSGGMQRKAAIARMLAYGGDVYLMDEPFTGLDDESKDSLISVIKERIKDSYALMITHDDYTAEKLGDRILLLEGPPLKIKSIYDNSSD